VFPASRHPVLAACFHLGILAVIVASISGVAPAVVARNSEGFAAVFLVTVGLQYLRVDLHTGRGSAWAMVMLAGLIITGPLRDDVGLSDSIATLQESFAAAAVLTFYFMRPPGWIDHGHHRGAVTLYVIGGILFVIGAFDAGGRLITDHAETLALVLLLAAYLDYVVGRLLTSRVIWFVAMAAIPVAYTVLNSHGNDVSAATNLWETSLVWLQRTTEAFVAVLLLQLYVELVSIWEMRRGETSVPSLG
jgi:hypothetical protein